MRAVGVEWWRWEEGRVEEGEGPSTGEEGGHTTDAPSFDTLILRGNDALEAWEMDTSCTIGMEEDGWASGAEGG